MLWIVGDNSTVDIDDDWDQSVVYPNESFANRHRDFGLCIDQCLCVSSNEQPKVSTVFRVFVDLDVDFAPVEINRNCNPRHRTLHNFIPFLYHVKRGVFRHWGGVGSGCSGKIHTAGIQWYPYGLAVRNAPR